MTQELQWDESEKSKILSSFYWGYLFTQVYAGQLAQKYGGKHLLSGAIGLCGIFTMITPETAIYGGVVWMCLNQAIQGMAQVSKLFEDEEV